MDLNKKTDKKLLTNPSSCNIIIERHEGTDAGVLE